MASVIAYIDGFNLYHGMKSAYGKKYLWLNVEAMVEDLIRPEDDLLATKYFTSKVTHIPESEKRQKTYLEALEEHTNTDIYYGRFQVNPGAIECVCGRTMNETNEKMTDVQIATHLITDAFTNKFERALIISGDADLIPAILSVKKHHPQKTIGVYFPPDRITKELKSHANFHGVIGEIKLRGNQLPQYIRKAGGFILSKPTNWV